MNVKEIKNVIKKYCETDKAYTEESFNKLMHEKLGSNYPKILIAFFEIFSYHTTKA